MNQAISRRRPYAWASLAALAALALAAAACQTALPLPGAQPPTPTGEAGQPAPLSAQAMPASGKLAVTGTDGNIYVLEAGQTVEAITTDALPFSSGLSGRAYQQPTWSANGWLSFVMAETLDSGATRQVVMAARPASGDPAISIYETSNSSYIYGYWSPAACPDGPECGRLAYLMNDGKQIAMHLADVSPGVPAAINDSIVGRAAPFYYSWAPNGSAMLWHTNGDTLSIFDATASSVSETLPDFPGNFPAPGWSPVHNDLLFARQDGLQSRMIVASGDMRSDLGLPVGGAVFFGLSPDGSKVAYASGAFPLSPITVINADGSDGRVLANTQNVIAFFWSPDSTRLAVASLRTDNSSAPQTGTAAHTRRVQQGSQPVQPFQWTVVDVTTGTATLFAAFTPTEEEITRLQFFDQYAQSHRVWSPDGRYIVYAERPDSGSPAIRLIDTQNPDTAPLRLIDGIDAVFSFGG